MKNMKTEIYMTDKEIRNIWFRKELSDVAMCKCLAELNAVHIDIMMQKLSELNLISPELKQFETRMHWNSDDTERCRMLRLKGLSYKEIAKALNRSFDAVRFVCKKNNFPKGEIKILKA